MPDPVMTRSTSGYVPPRNGVFGGVATATNNLRTDVNQPRMNAQGLKTTIWYFGPSSSANDIDNGDTWTSNIPGIVAVAWQSEDADDDQVTVHLSNQATGEITFIGTGTNHSGWVHVLSAG